MNISSIQNTNSINFQKKLVAKAGIITDGKTEDVNIYRLDKRRDIRDIRKALNNPIWEGNYYLNCELFKHWNGYRHLGHIYTIEDKNKNILCYSVIYNKGLFNKSLELIETAPKISRYNKKDRKSKYIGETMLAFIASKLKGKNLDVPYVNQEFLTKSFYTYCNFELGDRYGAILKKDNAKKLIEQNFQHTGKKIELIT